MSRLEGNNINNPTNDQEDMMLEIMSLLNDTVTPVPDVGNFYTFVYNPKTPNITYDQHPLIACTGHIWLGISWFKFSLAEVS